MNDDLNYEVAEKVMGWKEMWPESEAGDHFSAHGDRFKYGQIEPYWDGSDDYPMNCDQWNPLENLNQCFTVVEEVIKKCGRFTLEFNGEWWAYFEGRIGENAKTPNEAILRAAVEALD